jgi:tetratricopeptide (TPR) repeat protein
MTTRKLKHLVYGCCLCLGLLCCAFAIQQYWYVQLVASGNQAVSEKRFDTQAYDRASRFWFARKDILFVNQGVLAYKAQNLPRAADYFRRVSRAASNTAIEGSALYNLGRIFLELKDVERAAEFFKAALRLTPSDHEAKYNLERLYHFVLHQQEEHSESSLEQVPSPSQQESDQGGGGRQGRRKPEPDI